MDDFSLYVHDAYLKVTPLGMALVFALGVVVVLGLTFWTVRRNRH